MAKRKVPLAIKLLVWLLILVVILGGIGWAYWGYLKSPVNPGGEVQAFVVQKGESINEVAQQLEDKKIIHSAFAFKTQLKLAGDSAHVEAGDFKVSPSMSTEEVIAALSKGAI